MYDGLYKVRHFAWFHQSTIIDFPMSIHEVEPGSQDAQCWHSHDSVELAIITAGTGRHVLTDRRAPVRAGDVLVVYPGQKHGYEECDTLGILNLLYDSSRLPLPILDGEKIPLFRRLFPEDLTHVARYASPAPILHFDSPEALETIREKFQSLARELTTTQAGNMLFTLVKLLDIILSILDLADARRQPKHSEKRAYPLAAILEYINQNFTKKITVANLVKMSRLSERVFQYTFKQLTGYSVTQYILRKRLEWAKKRLADAPEGIILDVAFDAGFRDLSYFTSQFRKTYGITPKQYRVQATGKGREPAK